MGNYSRFHSPKLGTSGTKTGSLKSSYLLGFLGLWLRLHGAVIWDHTRRRALAQARESLEQGCTATAQVGLFIAQAKTVSAQVRKRNGPPSEVSFGDGI
jgi:hypothetical protein